ncbi:recombinase family protein [Spongiactinospora sp. TRM90649]|uniref:recombinase family protein n=1 Tax=Spongiactinospora sp. TRM90649 TaxID=3031114 RepID=UPI0023F72A05|nr:recombinase family protein [Spongiactinospora sp. TRM90649]MDF5756547.1 recombinase family protein [Spongiactinospora sp. TRM90649]
MQPAAHFPVLPGGLKPAIGYVRVSMMLGEKISPEVQMDSISACAARKGFYVPEGLWPHGGWIVELDVSGRDFKRDIQIAVQAVEQRVVRAIIVWEFSRFGRDREGNPTHLGRIERAGGELVSATEDVDARTPAGRLARGIHFEFAAYYSDLVGQRWSEAFQNRLKRGLPPLGGDYFGYVRRGRQPHPLFHDRTLLNPADGPERYEPDVEGGTGGALADMYAIWLTERNFYGLAKSLNMQGIRKTTGREWHADEVAEVLDHGFGAGKISVHDPDCECGRPSRCGHRVLFPGTQRPVIGMATWEAYVDARQEMQRLPRKSRTSRHSLSGLIVHGPCGGVMHVSRPAGDLQGFKCGWRQRQGARTAGAEGVVVCQDTFVQRSLVIRALLDVLAEWVPMIEEAARATRPEPGTSDSKQQAMRRLQRELRRLDAELDEQTMLLARKVIPEDAYVRVRDKCLADRAAKQAALDTLEGRAKPGRDALAAVPVIEGLVAEWDSLAVTDRRRLLMEVIERVEVWRDRLDIARIVVVPRWEGGQPVTRELPGRRRMEAVRRAIPVVLAERFGGAARYERLREVVAEAVPASKKVFNAAILGLAAEGALVREPLKDKQGTVYRLPDAVAEAPAASGSETRR